MFQGNTPKQESYEFEAQSFEPNPDYLVSGEELSELMQNPELMFGKINITQQDKYSRHYANREHLMDRSRFLGMGNDGLVTTMADPDKDVVCVKFIWKNLEVYPGKGETIYDPELLRLQEISKQFDEIRRITRANQKETNQNSVIKNTPKEEAVMQQSSQKILASENQNCYIPRIVSVEHFHEIEDESIEEPNPLYFLNEDYTTIKMQKVMGKSIQDIILEYPETEKYLELINLDKMEQDVVSALTSLHEHKIKHQDITIRNIMFDAEANRPALIDFGKSKYGIGDIEEDTEMGHVKEVFNHLRAFFRNPEEKREHLIEELRKRAEKIGI